MQPWMAGAASPTRHAGPWVVTFAGVARAPVPATLDATTVTLYVVDAFRPVCVYDVVVSTAVITTPPVPRLVMVSV